MKHWAAEVGDMVQVAFIGEGSLLTGTVLNVPQQPGDIWVVRTGSGDNERVHYIENCETVTVLRRGE